jgi:hypothetical protein
VRALLSIFVVVLIALSIAGWLWAGSHQPPPASLASRLVLTIGALAGVVGLGMLWRRPS